MARVNIDTLGISELKWTGMGENNSDDHYIYYCGQESLRRNGVVLLVKNRVDMQYLSVISKTTKWSQFVSKANHSTSQQSKSTPQPLMLKKLKLNSSMKTYKTSRTNTPKRCPFLHRWLEWKNRKSRDTQSNSKVWPWSTKWSRGKANRVLSREHTDNTLVIANTLFQQPRDNFIHGHHQSIPKSDWLYSLQQKMEKPYTVSRNKTVAQIMSSLLQNQA